MPNFEEKAKNDNGYLDYLVMESFALCVAKTSVAQSRRATICQRFHTISICVILTYTRATNIVNGYAVLGCAISVRINK